MSTGQRKINQDSFIAVTNLGGERFDRHLFGVYDGHGSNGHYVSSFVKEHLPSTPLSKLLCFNFLHSIIALLLNDRNLYRNPPLALINSYDICHKKLMMSEIDVKFSGTTAITILIVGDKVISANAGDSRAIMGKLSKGIPVII
mgnify:CR=1 FL=1